MTPSFAPTASMASCMPRTSSAALSSIVTASLWSRGSHSAPLAMTVSALAASLTCVGNPPPPAPTTPASLTCSPRLMGRISGGSQGSDRGDDDLEAFGPQRRYQRLRCASVGDDHVNVGKVRQEEGRAPSEFTVVKAEDDLGRATDHGALDVHDQRVRVVDAILGDAAAAENRHVRVHAGKRVHRVGPHEHTEPRIDDAAREMHLVAV